MMIHAARFRNFKALRNVELELDRFTVLVGPNASGKTSVLEGLHLLTQLSSIEPRRVFDGPADLGVIASRGAAGVLELSLEGTFRRKKGDLTIAFTSIEDYPFTDHYRLESRWGDRRFSTRRELHPPEEPPHAAVGDMPLGLALREAAFLRFEPARLAQPSYSELPTPMLESDGTGLAAVVADMAASRPDDFNRLQEVLRELVPGFLRVRLVRSKVCRLGMDSHLPSDNRAHVWGHEIVFDMVGANDIPARASSEGLLRILGLFATLIGSDRHELVLIDHLERGVSRHVYGELVAHLHQILALDPRLQIIAITGVPDLLDHVAAEGVRIHGLLDDGSVRIKPLTAHADYEMLRRDLKPGEFWSQVGEAWVAEEPPLMVTDNELAEEVDATEAAPPSSQHRFPPSMPPLPTGPSGPSHG